jgi:lactoylglutathione lyase
VYRYILAHEIGHFVFLDSFAGGGDWSGGNPELKADLIAGWLAGLAGDQPTAGSVVTSLLGCRSPGCSHPAPEKRTFAFLSGHSRGAQESARTAAKMKLLVLRVENLELSRAFYAGLGLELLPEKHGNGPLHYSCSMQETVMELYPCSLQQPRPASVRLGFQATKDAFCRLNSSGLLRQPPQLLRRMDNAEVYLVRDPDENAIELELPL